MRLPMLMTPREGPGQLARRAYQAGDELRFEPREDFAAVLAARAGSLPDGPRWSMLRGGEVRGVGGLEHVEGQLWTAWFYAAPLSPREWRFAYEAARDVCRHAGRLGMAIETAARLDQPCALRILRAFGFAETGEEWRAPDGSRQAVFAWRGG